MLKNSVLQVAKLLKSFQIIGIFIYDISVVL